MFSDESDLFEVEENHVEFQEICSRLKNHVFPSPWKIFFKSEDKFISQVTEFVVDDIDLMKGDTNSLAPLFTDTAPDATKKDNSTDILIDKKKVCRLKESLLNTQDNSTVDHVKDFDIFFIISSSQISELFEALDILTFDDVPLSVLLNAFLHFKDKISIATAISLVHHVICPLMFDYKKNFSRSLLSIILKFSEVYPKAMVDEVLIPYSKKEAPDDLQSEIISQIVKTSLPNEYVSYSIKRILEHALPVENSFSVLQNLIERKVCHESALLDLLIKKLLSWTPTCNKNVKFTKLITSILSTYGNEFTDQQISICNEVVKSNKTIIKRAAENLLKKIKRS